MSLTARLEVRFSATQTNANDLDTAEFEPILRRVIDLADGTGVGQADILWVDERTVNASSNDDLDLAGVLSSAFGATIALAEVVGIIIDSVAANTTVLTVGVAGTNPWVSMFAASGDGIKVPPGAIFVLFGRDATALGAVSAGSADVLRIANASGASATYRIAIVGRSA